MSVVKTLALGASILGSMVTPTLAGSMRVSHQIPERPHRESHSPQPTPVAIASPTSTVNASAENLASLSGYLPAQSYASSFSYVPGGFARQVTTLFLGHSNNLAISYAPVASVAAPVAPVAAPVAPVAAPIAAVAPVASAYVAPAVTAAAPVASIGHNYAAFINFGNGPYSEAQSLTTGNAQAWYQSPSAQSVFHGMPTAAQQAAFQNEVVQVVQSTYNQSGLKVSLTTDPTQNYAHTLSVVSGASYTGNSQAIGITDVGNDGFSFIDKINLAKTPDELAEAVGHNIAHELMHAFGVAGHADQTGTYLDAATANWSTLTNAQTTFSPQTVQMLSTMNFLNGPGKEFTQGAMGLTGLEILTKHHPVTCHCPYCNTLRKLEAAEGLAGNAAPVPEPTTVLLWGSAIAIALKFRCRHRQRISV